MRRGTRAVLAIAVVALSGCGQWMAPATNARIEAALSTCPVEEPRAPTHTPRALRHVDVGDVPTAIDHARGFRLDLPGTAAQIRDWNARMSTVRRLTLPTTGLIVEVWTDGPLRVDPIELDRAFALPLVSTDHYRNPQMAALLSCYADRAIVRRELEGRKVRLLVPSDPRWCFQGPALVLRNHGTDVERCGSYGLTLPEVDVGQGPFDVVRLSMPTTIVIAPGSLAGDAVAAPDRAAWILVHEAVHLYDNAFGLGPHVGRLFEAYERRAYYVQRNLQAAADGPLLPFSYPLGPAAP